MTVSVKDHLWNLYSEKGSQFAQTLLEFSGACAGCAETPYAKLVTRLFGDRMIVSNATDCSSIWGGSAPSMPCCANREGKGPSVVSSRSFSAWGPPCTRCGIRNAFSTGFPYTPLFMAGSLLTMFSLLLALMIKYPGSIRNQSLYAPSSTLTSNKLFQKNSAFCFT